MVVYRRETRRRPILILAIITSLALITLDTGGNATIATVRRDARDLVAPIQNLVGDAVHPVEDLFDGITSAGSLREQNARLRAHISQLEGRLSRERAVGAEVGELERLLDLPTVEDATGIAARVIGGPPGNFERTLVIDRGLSSGVDVGMPVVAGAGLVGKIVDVSRTRATVRLIDSPGLGVGVRSEKSREQAITEGRAGDKLLRLGFLTNPRAPIAVGELVFTAGEQGSAFPPDIPVGIVKSIDRLRGDLDPDIFVQPMVDFDLLIFVKVLRPLPNAPTAPSATP
jgi:rod shape-determining protein MreC